MTGRLLTHEGELDGINSTGLHWYDVSTRLMLEIDSLVAAGVDEYWDKLMHWET